MARKITAHQPVKVSFQSMHPGFMYQNLKAPAHVVMCVQGPDHKLVVPMTGHNQYTAYMPTPVDEDCWSCIDSEVILNLNLPAPGIRLSVN